MARDSLEYLIVQYHDELIRLMDLCFIEGRFPGSNRMAIKLSLDGLSVALKQLLEEVKKS